MKGTAIFIGLMMVALTSNAQEPSYAREMTNTAMKLWKDSFLLPSDKVAKWRYDQGVILKGVEALWNRTGDGRLFDYIQRSMDFYLTDKGTIRGYKPDEYNIDHLNNGKLLLLLYRVTGKEKYKTAADELRQQLRTHPRTSEGGFWHKKIYPSQMWLDGLYMGQPFYAEYAKIFHEDTAYMDIARQFILMERHARDPQSGLLYHGWDESREQQWADKKTGTSPHFWGRALGWYGMAMVDALDHFPAVHPGRDSIRAILQRFAAAVVKVQDSKTGVWYDIPNLPNEPKNYVEASASSMLVYTLAKAVRKGYLPAQYLAFARKGYDGLVRQFIKTENGQVNLYGTVSVSGLGGKPYRNGSFDYYMSEPVIVNDPKGMGAFILAANEMEAVKDLGNGIGKTVLLDTYYNNEWKKDVTGKSIRWHYTWEDKSNSGFAMLGDIIELNGARKAELELAPNSDNLQNASVYIIVDPDTEKEAALPNIMKAQEAEVIANWVKNGGVLILLTNDAGNAELKNFNQLSSRFGIQFNEDNYNLVINNVFEQGMVTVPEKNPVFRSAKKLFIKELATLNVTAPAKTILSKDGKNIAAIAKFGKGCVFAIGDPWLYNEYIDGRKLPMEYDNYKAATDLVRWALKEFKKKQL